MEPRISDQVHTLSDHAREYINLKIEEIKLVLVEKLSLLTSKLILFIILFILLLFTGVFIALAFVLWFGTHVGPMWAGALIIVGLLILKMLVIYWMRRWFILNPLIRHLSNIIMEGQDHES